VTEVSGEPWANPSPTGKTHRLADVTLEVPVIPRTFYAAASTTPRTSRNGR